MSGGEKPAVKLRVKRPSQLAAQGRIRIRVTAKIASGGRCPVCGMPLYYIPSLRRYYCFNCKAYV